MLAAMSFWRWWPRSISSSITLNMATFASRTSRTITQWQPTPAWKRQPQEPGRELWSPEVATMGLGWQWRRWWCKLKFRQILITALPIMKRVKVLKWKSSLTWKYHLWDLNTTRENLAAVQGSNYTTRGIIGSIMKWSTMTLSMLTAVCMHVTVLFFAVNLYCKSFRIGWLYTEKLWDMLLPYARIRILSWYFRTHMCVLPKMAKAPVLKYQLLPQPFFAYPKLSASVLNYHFLRY